MKKFWAAVAVVVVAGGLYFLLKSKNPSTENSAPPNEVVLENGSHLPGTPSGAQGSSLNSSNGAISTAPPPNDLASRAASPNATPDGTTPTNEVINLPPLTVLDKARVTMLKYRTAFGENPVGTNPEITAALTGDNPKKINFVTPDSGLRVNEKGELLDGYGTPFFFHQMSGTEMEIRSAGQDRVLWTPDDLVTR